MNNPRLFAPHPFRDEATGRLAFLRSPAAPVTLAYLLIGGLWILLSDWALSVFVPPERVRELQTLKGWAFVAVTALLLWVVLHGYWRARLRAQEHQEEVERALQVALEGLEATILRFASREPYPILAVTDGIAGLTGHEPADLLADPPRSAVELIHPEDRLVLFTAVRASARDGRGFVLELRVQTLQAEAR